MGRNALKNKRTGIGDDLGVINIDIEHTPPMARLINNLFVSIDRL